MTHFKNFVNDRGERESEYRNFHKRSLSRAESDAVGGRLNISWRSVYIVLPDSHLDDPDQQVQVSDLYLHLPISGFLGVSDVSSR